MTKYRIVKPGKDNVTWDDFLLALPEKDQLAKFSKEVPLFIRYLKAFTDTKQKPEIFKAFVERAKDGLEVESDVYITTEELLAVMWKNGYTEEERNSIQFTFPSDYHFHYPELAAMFELGEEDTYKFCMRTRIEKSHIGQLNTEQVKRKGLIRDHWLIFGTGAFIFKTFPFYNYYFILKGFGAAMFFVSNYMLFARGLMNSAARNEYMAQQKTALEVMEGESKIMDAMKRFARDAECVDFLKSFKEETQNKLTSYRKAIVEQQKVDMSQRATKQLQSIAQFEHQMNSQLQELVVKEAASAFKSNASDATTQKAFMESAITALANGKMENDPVTKAFQESMQALHGVDLASTAGNASGSIVERVAAAQQAKEKEFKGAFMVTAAEAKEVQSLGQKAAVSEGEYDFSRLSADEMSRLENLHSSINQKVGYHLPDGSLPLLSETAGAEQYVSMVNAEIEATNAKVRHEKLSSFVSGF